MPQRRERQDLLLRGCMNFPGTGGCQTNHSAALALHFSVAQRILFGLARPNDMALLEDRKYHRLTFAFMCSHRHVAVDKYHYRDIGVAVYLDSGARTAPWILDSSMTRMS